MSGFKDMIQRDLDVVLNLEEMGEEHEINGKNVVCVFDENELSERSGGTEYAVGLSYKMLYAKCSDLPGRLGYGAELMVDGIPYMVQKWDEDMGMASVELFIAMNT